MAWTKHQGNLVIIDSYLRGVCVCGYKTSLSVIDRHRVEAALVSHIRDASSCRKQRFATEEEALNVLVDLKIKASLRHRQKRREDRAYWCQECEAWHLTSKEKFFA